MKIILLGYLLLAIGCTPLRRWHGVLMVRLGHALALWKTLDKPWRVAWAIACRRHP